MHQAACRARSAVGPVQACLLPPCHSSCSWHTQTGCFLLESVTLHHSPSCTCKPHADQEAFGEA